VFKLKAAIDYKFVFFSVENSIKVLRVAPTEDSDGFRFVSSAHVVEKLIYNTLGMCFLTFDLLFHFLTLLSFVILHFLVPFFETNSVLLVLFF